MPENPTQLQPSAPVSKVDSGRGCPVAKAPVLPDSDEADEPAREQPAADAGRDAPGKALIARAQVSHLVRAERENERGTPRESTGQNPSPWSRPYQSAITPSANSRGPSTSAAPGRPEGHGRRDQDNHRSEPDDRPPRARERVDATKSPLHPIMEVSRLHRVS